MERAERMEQTAKRIADAANEINRADPVAKRKAAKSKAKPRAKTIGGKGKGKSKEEEPAAVPATWDALPNAQDTQQGHP